MVHLEPEHVRDLLIPVPSDAAALAEIVKTGKEAVEAREKLEALNEKTVGDLSILIQNAIASK